MPSTRHTCFIIFPSTSFPWVPKRQKTCSTSIIAIGSASLRRSGNASAHLIKHPHKLGYRYAYAVRSGQVNIQQAVAVLYVGAVLGDIHCKARNAYRNGSCLPSRQANKIVASLGRVYVVCQSGLLSFLRDICGARLALTYGERVTANKVLTRLSFNFSSYEPL